MPDVHTNEVIKDIRVYKDKTIILLSRLNWGVCVPHNVEIKFNCNLLYIFIVFNCDSKTASKNVFSTFCMLLLRYLIHGGF